MEPVTADLYFPVSGLLVQSSPVFPDSIFDDVYTLKIVVLPFLRLSLRSRSCTMLSSDPLRIPKSRTDGVRRGAESQLSDQRVWTKASFSRWQVRIFTDVGECKKLCSVTASGEKEQQLLTEFLEQVPEELCEIIDQFPVLFAPPDREPPPRNVKHMIYMPLDHVPAARNAYPLSGTKLEAMRTQMTELIDKGWVLPSESPWAAPFSLFRKTVGKHCEYV